jgi:hypothetical protein
LAGSKYGSVKVPQAPSRGNDVKVRGASLGFRYCLARFRLINILEWYVSFAVGFLPIAHVRLNAEQVPKAVGVGGPWGRL